MPFRETIQYWANRSKPFIGLIIIVGLCVASVLFLPSRGGAAALGIISGFIITYFVIFRLSALTQTAVLCCALTVSADAAYAKLNDLTSATLANILIKIIDNFLKLADPVIRGLGLTNPRGKFDADAPDFVWALILTYIALAILRSMIGRDASKDKNVRR